MRILLLVLLTSTSALAQDLGNWSSSSGGLGQTAADARYQRLAANNIITAKDIFGTTNGPCVGGDADNCLISDGAGGYLLLDETGATVLTLSTAGVVTFTGQSIYSGVAVDITTGTDQDLTITPNGTGEVVFGTEVQFQDGSAGAPSVVWDSDDDSGFYWNGNQGTTSYSQNGTRRWTIDTSIASGAASGAVITSAAGGAALPIFTANGDLDSGFARIAADDWGPSVAGVTKLHTNATATAVATDGVAIATQEARVGGVIETNITAVGNVGAGTDDLMTYSLAASSLGTDMQSVSFQAWGTFGATANNKTLTAAFGGTTIISSGSIAANTGDWRMNCTIVRTAAATQDASCTLQTSNAALVSTVDFTSPGETLSGAVTIKLTATATDDNDIVQEGWIVRWDPQN